MFGPGKDNWYETGMQTVAVDPFDAFNCFQVAIIPQEGCLCKTLNEIHFVCNGVTSVAIKFNECSMEVCLLWIP